SGEIRTEADAAMLIEVEAGKRGCEGTSFETLSAGPKRSFGIHAFPSRTSGPFATDGLSILDFGVRYRGYCTDITMTFARALNREQEAMLGLVEEAAAEVSRIIAPGTSTTEMTGLVEGLFAKAGRKMEHGLGHGVGLDVHEFPSMRSLGGPGWKLEPGMVVAVEPGLYDSAHGGCRLENDFLVTKAGHEVLTRSRVVRL
ncbi:MAG: M24 family metallopeptidase, partial [Treponema sp.]|nr:M24 family metallopeptidase [Treponema sp.]